MIVLIIVTMMMVVLVVMMIRVCDGIDTDDGRGSTMI